MRLPIRLNLGVFGTTVSAADFRIDSASDITQVPATYIPESVRPRLNQQPLRRFRTASGVSEGRDLTFVISFAALPGWSFPCLGLVNERIHEGLLAWRDIARRFEIRTVQRTLIPDLRDRLVSGRPGAWQFSLYPSSEHDGMHERR